MKRKLPERRRFVRITTPLRVMINDGDRTDEIVTKNISPIGLRFEIAKELTQLKRLTLSLYLPLSEDPIQLNGKVVWQTKTSLEDNAPYDVGFEIIDIEENNKNTFLRYLCDILYDSTYQVRG